MLGLLSKQDFRDFSGITLKLVKWRIDQIQFKETLEKSVILGSISLRGRHKSKM